MRKDGAAEHQILPIPVRLRAADVTWSILVRNLGAEEMFGMNPDAVLSTASVGKILLLAEVARRIEDGRLSAYEFVHRSVADSVADSGLWQHLDVDALTVRDAAVLIAATSDNLATNVLLRRLGVEAMDETAQVLGLEGVRLHDYVRDVRGPADPPRLSCGSAQELANIFERIATRRLISPEVSRTIGRWLGLNTDLSMVASALDLDPLAHAADGPALAIMNKTGTDTGVRADCGLVACSGVKVAYAAVANWDPAVDSTLGDVMDDMRAIGGFIRSIVATERPSGA